MQASTRWRNLVRARAAELDRLKPGRGALGAAYWDVRAKRYAARVEGSAERDPFLVRVGDALAAVGDGATVLDVGAGPGRLSLPLAAMAAEVVAVDPSSVMLAILRRQARRLGLRNISVVEGRWEEVEVPEADVVICSHVLPVIEDAAGFLAKVDAACRRQAFVYMAAISVDAPIEHFWAHFHGKRRRPGPTYLDLVDVLAELGIVADVEVVEVPTLVPFRTLAEAVTASLDTLVLDDTPVVRRELRALYSSWLVATGGGLRAPMATTPAAIVSWKAEGASGPDPSARQRRRPER